MCLLNFQDVSITIKSNRRIMLMVSCERKIRHLLLSNLFLLYIRTKRDNEGRDKNQN